MIPFAFERSPSPLHVLQDARAKKLSGGGIAERLLRTVAYAAWARNDASATNAPADTCTTSIVNEAAERAKGVFAAVDKDMSGFVDKEELRAHVRAHLGSSVRPRSTRMISPCPPHPHSPW